jgi:hypothetical protein
MVSQMEVIDSLVGGWTKDREELEPHYRSVEVFPASSLFESSRFRIHRQYQRRQSYTGVNERSLITCETTEADRGYCRRSGQCLGGGGGWTGRQWAGAGACTEFTTSTLQR